MHLFLMNLVGFLLLASSDYSARFSLPLSYLGLSKDYYLWLSLFSYLICSVFFLMTIGVTLLPLLFFFQSNLPSNCSSLHTKSCPILSIAPRLSNSPQQLGAENMVMSFLSQMNQYPSSTTWCERQIKSKSLRLRNKSITFLPQQQLMPRSSLSLHPSIEAFGSDQRISETMLFPKGSIGRFMLFKDERFFKWGLSPP